ncbi:MAG: glutathione S-transferase N-terminal domain-containing protein [Euryarchaeota archaeon]|nr:glutathione S-transferase N-terminal domain-containing protein [Euryarchaeota archaeon]
MAVKVYSTPTCPFCDMVKKYLRENDVEFEDVNVAEDAEAAKEMTEKSGRMTVPLIDIDGEIIVGFDREKLDKALGL